MGRDRAIAGGLLSGLGQGIMLKGQNERQDRLIEQENARILARQLREDYIRQVEGGQRRREAGLRREHDRGLLSNVITQEGGDVIGVTRGGETKNLGIKAAPKAGESGFSASDKRLWDTVTDRHTKKDLAGETTDWAKVAADFTRQGRTDLAQLAKGPDTSSDAIDVNSDQYLEAQRMAEEWIAEQTTVFGRDKTQLAEYGGNRAQALQAKTMEFYEQLTGTKRPSGGAKAAASGPTTTGSGTKPGGSGTESDPYRATSQEHVDWFKANAAAGEIIEVDGTLYKK